LPARGASASEKVGTATTAISTNNSRYL
jgi:hypothetical protein